MQRRLIATKGNPIARLGINTCLSGLRPENPEDFQKTAFSPCSIKIRGF